MVVIPDQISRDAVAGAERDSGEAAIWHTCRLPRRYSPVKSKPQAHTATAFHTSNTAAAARRRRDPYHPPTLSPMAAAARAASAARSPLLVHHHRRRLPQVRTPLPTAFSHLAIFREKLVQSRVRLLRVLSALGQGRLRFDCAAGVADLTGVGSVAGAVRRGRLAPGGRGRTRAG